MVGHGGEQVPIATFQSGPVNSLRGAAFLSGITDGVVCDLGGTTTDVGRIACGLPCPSTGPVTLAGARTNFRMPDVVSIGVPAMAHGAASALLGRCPPARLLPASDGMHQPAQGAAAGTAC